MKLLAALGLIWIGYWIGWWYAHVVVATECKRLGAFYVGRQVFKCVEVAEPQENE